MQPSQLRLTKRSTGANIRLRLAIGGRLLAGFGLGLVAFVGLNVVSYSNVRQSANATDWVRHTHEVLTRIQKVDSDILGVQTAIGGFLVTGQESTLSSYYNLLRELDEDERALRRLTADNPRQQTRLTALEDLLHQRLAWAQQVLDLYRRGGFIPTAGLISAGRGQEIMKDSRLVLGALARAEEDLLVQRDVQVRTSRARMYSILIVRTFTGFGLLLALLFFLNAEAAGRRDAEANNRLSAEIVKSSNDAVITKTLGGIITSWNPGAERIFGYTAREAIGHPVQMFIPPECADEEKNILARIESGETVEQFETVRLRKDGRRANVSVTVSPLREKGGQIAGATKILRDITQRKKAEEAHRTSEGRYRALFENAPDGILVADPESTCLEANASICRMLGYTSEELIGMRATDIVAPSDFEQIGAPLTAINVTHHYHREWQFRRKDNSFFVGELIAASMPDGNLVAMIRDITERKHAERRLEMRNTVSQILADATSVAEATPGIIRAICEAEIWDVGTIWEIDAASEVLRCQEVWYRGDFPGAAMAEQTRGLSFAMGHGLPGRVWAAGEMRVIPDLALDEGYLRGGVAYRAGLHSALAFPILVDKKVIGVIDLAAREIRQPDSELAKMLLAIGRQVGQFVDRGLAEEALREGEERFRTMANSIPQLAWIAHPDGFIYWYNERWYEYTGTTAEQMEGWGWQTVLAPEALPEVLKRWGRAIAANQPVEMEFPLRAADGTFRTFLTRVFPLKDAEGRVLHWFGTNTDVDELKRMEGSLRASQMRLNSTLAAGSIGTWTWDIPNDCLSADEFTARMFSIDPDVAAKGLPAEVYLRAVMKEDRQVVADGLSRAIQSCGKYDIEYRVRPRDGKLRWLQARGRVEGDQAGAALNFHGTVLDITERKQTDQALRESEEHFRFLNNLFEATQTLADAEQIMATTARMLGEHLHVSRCAYADVEQGGEQFTILHDYTDGCASTVGSYQLSLFGTRSGATLRLGRTLIIRDVHAELLPSEGLALFRAIGIAAIITCPLLKKDGSLSAMMAVHQTTARDWTLAEITIVKDVAQRCWSTIERRGAEENIRNLNVELEQRVVERTAQLEAANRAKSMFLSTMSHEIRTPMNAILGYSQLMLRDSLLGTDAKANLRIINRSGEHLLTLINDVLDMAKIEAGRTELNPTTFRLAGLVDDVAGMSRLRANAKALGFQVFFDRGSELYVVADEGKIRQVLINLLANAVKFTQQGEISLHITLEQRKDNRPWLAARVEDTGPGISDQDQEKLFDPFSRAGLGINSQEGTGLGLAIARRHARLMGGDVTVGSRPGTGSIFRFEIPVALGVTGFAVRNAASRRVVGIHAGVKSPGILIVDDQIENRDWLMKLLAAIGLPVRSADNGESAIRAWQEWKPQMILMDVHMPVMDGLEATRRIKADPRGGETVIVALTASAMDEERRIAFESGADGFLAKPCREDDLLEMIRVFLDIVYDYDETLEIEPELGAGLRVLNLERLGKLPRELIDQLRDAALNGNKRLLNNLILTLRQGNDAECADGIQDLANSYQYHTLAQLLGEACGL